MSRAQLVSVRVLTWNIHKGIGGVDRRYDLARIIEVLRHYRPDIALLQEVAQFVPQLQHDDQVSELAESSGLFHAHAYHAEHQFRRGGYGNLIASRFPLSGTEHLDLTVGFRKKRGMVHAHAEVPIGSATRSIAIYNLHLGLAGSERGKQLKFFLKNHPFRGMPDAAPLIVGGDLNDLWGSLGPKFLAPAGLARAGGLVNTFPAALPLRPLDGLFYRGDLVAQRTQLCRTDLARQASDHLPLLAEFTVALAT